MHAMGGTVWRMAGDRRISGDRHGENAEGADGAGANACPLVPTFFVPTGMIALQLQSPVSSPERPFLRAPAWGGGGKGNGPWVDSFFCHGKQAVQWHGTDQDRIGLQGCEVLKRSNRLTPNNHYGNIATQKKSLDLLCGAA
jgi:hypothetical protein